MTEGKIVAWNKSEGDRLSKGDSVVVVESDKADMDVETFYDGILAAVVVAEGETAPVGAPIGLLAETEEEIEEARARARSLGQPGPPPTPAAPATPAPPPPPPPKAPEKSHSPGSTVLTPYAKKLAKQYKVDVGSLVGSGPYGRITPADVEAAAGIAPVKVATVAQAVAPPSKATAPAAPAPKSIAPLPEIPGATVVPFTGMQSAVSKNMVESLSVPTFRVGYPVKTDALDALYEKVPLALSLSPLPNPSFRRS